MIDMHIHSLFSGDSSELPLKIAEAAHNLSLKVISITDHYDPMLKGEQEVEFGIYFDVLQSVREAYPDMYISAGLELGFNSARIEDLKLFFRKYPFENVIMSIHRVEGIDCHKPEYFEDKNKQKSFELYLLAVLESVQADCYFTTLGHLGYIERYAPFSDPTLYYEEHSEIIDQILQTIIDRNKILEINARRGGLLPSERILSRYKEMGGQLITYGSDAHTAKQVGQRYQKAVALAQSLGFKGFTIVKDRKYELISF